MKKIGLALTIALLLVLGATQTKADPGVIMTKNDTGVIMTKNDTGVIMTKSAVEMPKSDYGITGESADQANSIDNFLYWLYSVILN